MKIFKLLIPSLFFATNYNLFAQRISVTYDTKTEKISDSDLAKIPFDEQFNIKINDNSFSQITPFYKLINKKAKDTDTQKYYYFDSISKNNDFFILPTVNSNTGTFNILIPPLHVNEAYEFKFEILKKISLNDEGIKNFKESIFKEISTNVNYNNIIDTNSINQLYEGIKNSIKTYSKSKEIYDIKSEIYSLEEDPVFKDIMCKIIAANNNIFTKKNIIFDYNKITDKPHPLHFFNILTNNKTKILALFDSIINDEKLISFLNQPVNTVINQSQTNEQILEIIKSDLVRNNLLVDLKKKTLTLETDPSFHNSYLQKIFIGKGKISGNIVVTSNKYDLDDVKLLMSFFESLKNYKDVNKLTTEIPLDSILTSLHLLEAGFIEINKAIEIEKNLINEIPNLLEDKFLNSYNRTEISINPEIFSQATPYIGIDIGVITAPLKAISSTFFYQGLNFYFRPINKNAPFKNFKYKDKYLKRLSLNIGIAQRFGNNTADGYLKLFGGGSPFIGIGFRVSNIIRLSSGMLFYERSSTNPIIDKSLFKVSPFISLSVDTSFKTLINIFIPNTFN